MKERSIDHCNYEDDDCNKISVTPCQKILRSYEKENNILKSEVKLHTNY